jgi:hypothetical protein
MARTRCNQVSFATAIAQYNEGVQRTRTMIVQRIVTADPTLSAEKLTAIGTERGNVWLDEVYSAVRKLEGLKK